MKPGAPPKKTSISPPAFFSKAVAQARRFYLDLHPRRQTPLAVVCGGLEHCTADYAIARESFPFYSIEYVLRGRGALKLGRHPCDLRPGCLFAYGPGIAHHITSDPDDPLVKYFVDFKGTEAVRLLASCKLAPGHVSKVFPAQALQPLFDEIIQAGSLPRRGGAALCRKLLECLALRIDGARAPMEGAETLAFATYQHCRQFVETHFRRLRTLEQIAGECHVNHAYLCRLFQRYDQQTPYQYLIRLKMNFAAEQLQQRNALVKQIAEQAGFTDPFHFSRVFTTVFGVSPAAFRRLR